MKFFHLSFDFFFLAVVGHAHAQGDGGVQQELSSKSSPPKSSKSTSSNEHSFLRQKTQAAAAAGAAFHNIGGSTSCRPDTIIVLSNAVKTLEGCENSFMFSDVDMTSEPLSPCRTTYADTVSSTLQSCPPLTMNTGCGADYFLRTSNAVKTLESCEDSFIVSDTMENTICLTSFANTIDTAVETLQACAGAVVPDNDSACRDTYYSEVARGVEFRLRNNSAFLLATSNAIKELEECESNFKLEVQVRCVSSDDCSAECGVTSACIDGNCYVVHEGTTETTACKK